MLLVSRFEIVEENALEIIMVFTSFLSFFLSFFLFSFLFPKGLFPVGVPVKILKALLPSSILTTKPAHLSLLNLTIRTIYKVPHCGGFSTPPLKYFLGPNIHLRILFSNTLCLRSSLNVRCHASQSYSATGNIIVLYILIFKFLERSREDKLFGMNINMNFLL